MSEILKNDCTSFIAKMWGNNFILEKNTITQAYQDIIKNHKTFDKPVLIKLGGQSGSGKTTQLFPSIEYGLKNNNIDFIHIAVRMFAKYHPEYDELINKFGVENIRENTNAFALTLLFGVFELLIKNKYNVFYEVTMLEPDFEEYTVNLAKQYNYSIIYNILSVPLELSNLWIKKREQGKSEEKGRKVSSCSSNYFYQILPKALERLINIKNNENYFILWNCYQNSPIFEGYTSENVLNIFNQEREKNIDVKSDEDDLLESKKMFYDRFFLPFFQKVCQ